jgi:hypothetical protein
MQPAEAILICREPRRLASLRQRFVKGFTSRSAQTRSHAAFGAFGVAG